jgi:hypothetical protein
MNNHLKEGNVKKTGIGLALASVFALGLLGAPHARAQLSNMIQGAMGGGNSGASGMDGMGGLSMPELNSASPTNLAGVLQFCVQNNYLGSTTNGNDSAASASSVKQSLLSKFTGSSSDPTSNSDFTSGSVWFLMMVIAGTRGMAIAIPAAIAMIVTAMPAVRTIPDAARQAEGQEKQGGGGCKIFFHGTLDGLNY